MKKNLYWDTEIRTSCLRLYSWGRCRPCVSSSLQADLAAPESRPGPPEWRAGPVLQRAVARRRAWSVLSGAAGLRNNNLFKYYLFFRLTLYENRDAINRSKRKGEKHARSWTYPLHLWWLQVLPELGHHWCWWSALPGLGSAAATCSELSSRLQEQFLPESFLFFLPWVSFW